MAEISTITGKPEPTFKEKISLLEAGVEYLRSNLFGEQPSEDLPDDFGQFISESSFAERSKVVDSPNPSFLLGEIQGLSKGAAKAVRKLMQAETKARGAAPKLIRQQGNTLYGVAESKDVSIYDVPSTWTTFDKEIAENLTKQKSQTYGKEFHIVRSDPKTTLESDPISSVLRGTFYHGRTTLPEAEFIDRTGEGKKLWSKITEPDPFKPIGEGGIVAKGYQPRRPDLRGARGKKLNIGEPTGVSLSYDPVVAHKFSKRPDNELARVMPLYGGPPEDVIINAWTPQGGAVMKEAYLDAGKEIIRKRKDSKYKLFGAGEKIDIDSNEAFKQFLSQNNLETKFNEILTKRLQSKGYKGILYSPHRFDEYELKMFDPGDALVVDRRKMLKKTSKYGGMVRYKTDPTFKRMNFGNPEGADYVVGETETMTMMGKVAGGPNLSRTSLRDWYRELDVAKELGLRKGPAPGTAGYDVMKANPEGWKKYKKLLDKADEPGNFKGSGIDPLEDIADLPSVDPDEYKKYKKMLDEAEELGVAGQKKIDDELDFAGLAFDNYLKDAPGLKIKHANKLTDKFEVGSWEVVDSMQDDAVAIGYKKSIDIYNYIKSKLKAGGFKKKGEL